MTKPVLSRGTSSPRQTCSASKYLVFTNADANTLFLIDDSSPTRTNGVNLRHRQLQLDNTKFYFTNDVVREWNKLPPFMAQCNTINSPSPPIRFPIRL